MTTQYPFVVLPAEAARRIAEEDASEGVIGMTYLQSEDMYVVRVVGTKEARVQVTTPDYSTLNWGGKLVSGTWLRKPADSINESHLDTLIRGGDLVIPFNDFKTLVPVVQDPGTQTGFLITFDPDLPEEWRELGAQTFAAWMVSRHGVRPIPLAVEPPNHGLAQLDGKWPIDVVQSMTIAVIGIGSIGGAIVEALANYGIGTIHLVDPDRFLWHNMVRHVLGPEAVGRYKVDAMKARVNDRWPDTKAIAHRLDVVNDAHVMRALFSEVDLVVCAADGIAPRRVASHVARRAGIPAVLACVLDDGAIGELVRLRPAPRYGCLLCLREDLHTRGAIDVEAAQELDYGTGHIHRPMTAVSADLHVVGQLAAKAALATLLEARHGDHTQLLPEDHATIGLRPPGDMAPPFNLTRALEINWSPLPRPRPGCPTCKP